MLAKIGLIAVVVLFGALLFVLGMLMPDSVRAGLTTRFTAATQTTVSAQKRMPAKNAAAIAAAPPAAKNSPPPVQFKELLVPTPAPLDRVYALQIGRFPTSAAADVVAKRAAGAGLPTATIDMIDADGEDFKLVTAGRYSSPEDARAARISLTRKLELAQPLEVIMLPAAPAAATQAAGGT
jgi:cell division septation protein DedD